MRAMILAAGRGERMGVLTQTLPKPLIRVGGQYLIEYAIQALATAGIHDIVINISYQADQIKQAIGNGSRYGVTILYSEEAERLETGGGIFKALPLLGEQPFLVMSSDIVTDFPIATLKKPLKGLAHLVLVNNPSFHPNGDFGLQADHINRQATPRFTFGNIGVYHPALFAHSQPGHFPLNQLLFPAIDKQEVTGELYQGKWHNIGTPEELQAFSHAK